MALREIGLDDPLDPPHADASWQVTPAQQGQRYQLAQQIVGSELESDPGNAALAKEYDLRFGDKTPAASPAHAAPVSREIPIDEPLDDPMDLPPKTAAQSVPAVASPLAAPVTAQERAQEPTRTIAPPSPMKADVFNTIHAQYYAATPAQREVMRKRDDQVGMAARYIASEEAKSSVMAAPARKTTTSLALGGAPIQTGGPQAQVIPAGPSVSPIVADGITAKDAALAVKQGTADIGTVVGKGLQMAGADTAGGLIRAGARRATDQAGNDMSPGGQAAAEGNVFNDDLSLGESPLSSLTLQALRSVPSMVATLPIGGGLAMGAEKVGGKVLVRLAKRPGVVGTLARIAPSATGAGVAEGIQAALQNAAQTEDQILATPLADIRKAPKYAELMAQADTKLSVDQRERQVRAAIAKIASDEVARRTLVSTGGIGILTGGGAEGLVLRKAAGTEVKEGVLKAIGKGIAEEAIQEAPQSGAEQYIQNVATKNHVDPTQNTMEGVISAAATGAAVGGATGGAMAGGGHVLTNPIAVRNKVLNTPIADLVGNPAYEKHRDAGLKPVDARAALATETATAVQTAQQGGGNDANTVQRVDANLAAQSPDVPGSAPNLNVLPHDDGTGLAGDIAPRADAGSGESVPVRVADAEQAPALTANPHDFGAPVMVVPPEVEQVASRMEKKGSSYARMANNTSDQQSAQMYAEKAQALHAEAAQLRAAHAQPAAVAAPSQEIDHGRQTETNAELSNAASESAGEQAQPHAGQDETGNASTEVLKGGEPQAPEVQTAPAAGPAVEEQAKSEEPMQPDMFSSSVKQAGAWPTAPAAEEISGKHVPKPENLDTSEEHVQISDKSNQEEFVQESGADHAAVNAANKEIDRQAEHDVAEALRDIEMNGNGADMGAIASKPEYWDAENEQLTDAGYKELDRQNREIALERAGAKHAESLEDMNHAPHWAQSDAMRAWLDSMGIAHQEDGSGSKYFVIPKADGSDQLKVRFANHANMVRNSAMTSDINVAPSEASFMDAIDAVLKWVGKGNATALDNTQERSVRADETGSKEPVQSRAGEGLTERTAGVNRNVAATESESKPSLDMSRLSVDQLTARMASVRNQARRVGGFTEEMTAQKKAIEAERRRRAKSASASIPPESGPRVIARTGTTPGSAQDIELRANKDGTVTPWQGGYEMADFTSGDPITLPAAVTNEEAIAAIRKAGALTNRDKVYSPNKAASDVKYRAAPQIATEAFKKWFGDSKVVDADGKPMVVYHGTNRSENGDAFSSFDTYGSNYGLYGQGQYFTENPAVASSYTTKGKGSSPSVYAAYLSIENPIDMDAHADADAWSKAFPDVDFEDSYVPDGTSNEAYYRQVEESLQDEQVYASEGVQIIQDGLRAMGFDGITHVGGGRVKSEGVKHKVFIAFDPEQIKSATGNRGTFDRSSPDIRMGRNSHRDPFAEVAPRKMSENDTWAAITPLVQSAQNLPPVVVLASPKQAEKGAVAFMKTRGALDDAAGLLYNGRIYLFSDHITSPEAAREFLLHEGLHFSLSGMLGESTRDSLMMMLYEGNDRMREQADRYAAKYDVSTVEATEEVLADMAGKGAATKLKGWDKLVATLKDWLRRAGMVKSWSDRDVQLLIFRAQRFWQRAQKGGYADVVRKGGALARGSGQVETNGEAGRALHAMESFTDDAGRLTLENLDVSLRRVGEYAQNAESYTINVPDAEGMRRVGDLFIRRGADGNISELRNIQIPESQQGKGYGETVVKSILASLPDGATLKIGDIQKSAEPFWRKMGTRMTNVSSDPNFDQNGVLTWSDYAKARSQTKTRVVEVGQGRDAAGRESADGQGAREDGGDGAEETGRLARRSQTQHDAVTESALAKAGLAGRPGLVDRVKESLGKIGHVWGDRVGLMDAARQGALDQFYGILRAERATVGNLPAEQSGYVAARLANGSSAVMRGLLLHGAAKWTANGQHLEKIEGSKGLLEILKPVQDEVDNWMGWMIGNRAARLIKEGREHNFTEDEIKALQALGKGKEALYKQVANEFAAFKRSVLDIAEHSGLIDPVGRKVWDHADWIPFYREREHQDTVPTGIKRGMAGQTSGIRTLKGGASALNDPLENILLNFNHLIDASLKNNALSVVVKNLEPGGVLEKVGYDMAQQVVPREQMRKELIAQGVPEDIIDTLPADVFDGMAKMWSIQAPKDPDVIRIMKNGKPQFYRVNDPLLLRAVTSFQPYAFPGAGTMRAFKRLLTSMVTSTPEFMARNFIRDSLSTMLIGKDRPTVAAAVHGVLKSYAEKGGFEDMMFAGASFAGGYIDAGHPEQAARAMRRALRAKGFDAASTDAFMSSLIDTPAKLWEHYRSIGEAIENANREAVYEVAIKNGKSSTEAAFESKDLMDFSLRGSWQAYQVLADVIPFFNARVQGLYRLGRTNPKALALRGALMFILPSVLLALANAGNKEYDELPDWDKDGYWHFFTPLGHFRIPKPFEVGVAFATIPERITQAILGKDSPKKFAERMWWNFAQQLNLVDWPQIIKPMVENYANKDEFSGRAIENQRDEGKLPSQRYDTNTSDTLRMLIGEMGEGADAMGLSPKKAQHLVEGYLGTVGAWALGAADMLARKAEGTPTKAAWRADDYPMLRIFYRESPAKSTQFVDDVFAMAQTIGEIKKSITALQKDGKTDDAAAMIEKYKDKLMVAGAIEGGAKYMSAISKQIDRVQRDPSMSADDKLKRITEFQQQRNATAAEIAKRGLPAFGGAP